MSAPTSKTYTVSTDVLCSGGHVREPSGAPAAPERCAHHEGLAPGVYWLPISAKTPEVLYLPTSPY